MCASAELQTYKHSVLSNKVAVANRYVGMRNVQNEVNVEVLIMACRFENKKICAAQLLKGQNIIYE